MTASWGIGESQLPTEAIHPSRVQIRLDNFSRFYVFDRDIHSSPGLGPIFGRPCFDGTRRTNQCTARRLSDGICVEWDQISDVCFNSQHPPAQGECTSRGCGRCTLTSPEACSTSEYSSVPPVSTMPGTPLFDWDYPSEAHWGRLVYPLGDDSAFHSVALLTQQGAIWGSNSVRSVRNYDVGAADVMIPWGDLASSLASSFRDAIASGITDCMGVPVPAPGWQPSVPFFQRVDQLNLAVSVGPLLSASSDFTGTDSDGITIRADETNFTGVLTPPLTLSVALPSMTQVIRIRPTVRQDPRTGAPAGANRVYVPEGPNYVVEGNEGHFTAGPFGVVDRNIGWTIADKLRVEFASSFASALNDRLRFVWRMPNNSCFPTDGTAATPGAPEYAFCNVPSQPGEKRFDLGRTNCVESILGLGSSVSAALTQFVPGSIMSGPESGCYPINAASVPAAILSDPAVAAAQSNGQGICVLRLEPSRINILPEGLQVVLAEGETETVTIDGTTVTRPDPEYTFLRNARLALSLSESAAARSLLETLSIRTAATRESVVDASRLAAHGTTSASRREVTCSGTDPGTRCALGACSRPSGGGSSTGNTGSQSCELIF
ncbi:MAG: hypothetical protein JWM10_1577 [Myxococcaceae bacterium]|nr:hypothetical protein [Myxococcaceae bacterium]